MEDAGLLLFRIHHAAEASEQTGGEEEAEKRRKKKASILIDSKRMYLTSNIYFWVFRLFKYSYVVISNQLLPSLFLPLSPSLHLDHRIFR